MIMAVSILGNPAALDAMRQLCDRHGLYRSRQLRIDGRRARKQEDRHLGEVNTFSFFFSHHISTMEGGMILTDRRGDRPSCTSIRAHGWTRDLPKGSPLFERRSSDHFEAYRSSCRAQCRPLEMSGAIAASSSRNFPLHGQEARELALFSGSFAATTASSSSRERQELELLFPIVLNPDLKAGGRKVFAALHDADIQFGIITGRNFLRHDAIRYFDYEIHGGATPNTDTAHDNGFSWATIIRPVGNRSKGLYRV